MLPFGLNLQYMFAGNMKITNPNKIAMAGIEYPIPKLMSWHKYAMTE